MDLDNLAQQLSSLGNRTRLDIYLQLVRAGLDGVPVGSIQRKLDIPASTLTHHLQKLIHAGLARQERDGTVLMCHARFEQMNAMIAFLNAECCADAAITEPETAAG